VTAPQRVQRSRTSGSRLPRDAVYVGRGSRWGNPWPVGEDGRAAAVDQHADWLAGHGPDDMPSGNRTYSRTDVLTHVAELAGRTLACWCPVPGPCHSDTLARLAARACNATTETQETP
jgi:hypothetical protein